MKESRHTYICKENPESKYLKIISELISERQLTTDEIGMLCRILNCPLNWALSVNGLSVIVPDGITKVRTILKNLERKEYLLRLNQSRNKGKFDSFIYLVADKPLAEKSYIDILRSGIPRQYINKINYNCINHNHNQYQGENKISDI